MQITIESVDSKIKIKKYKIYLRDDDKIADKDTDKVWSLWSHPELDNINNYNMKQIIKENFQNPLIKLTKLWYWVKWVLEE